MLITLLFLQFEADYQYLWTCATLRRLQSRGFHHTKHAAASVTVNCRHSASVTSSHEAENVTVSL